MRPRGGMTLVEILIATILLVVGLGSLLFGMYYVMIHGEYVKQAQVAMNVAQSQLEQLAAADFDTVLLTDASYCTPSPCNSIRNGDPERFDLNNDGDTTDPFDGQLAIQIRPVPLTNPTPDLLDIHVAACWQHRGRAIGGDPDGAVACADGADANWWVDSPISASTRVARR